MIHQASVVAMDRTLGALSAILSKADAHCTARKIDPAALTTARLFPDMFPLTRQVHLACDFGVRSAARLAGIDVPSFPDVEQTFAELADRIARARAFMATVTPDHMQDAETRPVTIKVRGQDMTLTGAVYLTQYALPNFHFHATTAYDILRHNGVELGKSDYMGA
ncbi:MAG: DUF1993 domain-containing protein [Pseudomonadota bacterium]|jgi:uncharacterized protein